MNEASSASTSATSASASEFQWNYHGRLIVIDNGARLPGLKVFDDLMDLNAFATVVFDPASKLHGDERIQALEEFQVFPHALLGDGGQTVLHACVDPAMSATLPPLLGPALSAAEWQERQVLTRLPIHSLPLDTIEGLDHVDWLLLDDRSDSLAALVHGEHAVADALLVSARVPFLPTHEKQTDLAQLLPWMTRHGFQFYGLVQIERHSLLPDQDFLEKTKATQWRGADALFIPDAARLDALDAERLTKLAFLLDTVHGAHDLAASLLARITPDLARQYLISRGYVSAYFNEPDHFELTFALSPAPWEHAPREDSLATDSGAHS